MTKSVRAPRLFKTAPVAAEQAPTHTSTHRESDDAYRVVAAPLAALPEKARDWRKN
jgi:hypothetical protein